MSAEILTKNLRELRKITQLSQRAFAEKIGYSQKRYAAWEENRAQPDIEAIEILAKEHNLTIDDLLTKEITKIFSHSI